MPQYLLIQVHLFSRETSASREGNPSPEVHHGPSLTVMPAGICAVEQYSALPTPLFQRRSGAAPITAAQNKQKKKKNSSESGLRRTEDRSEGLGHVVFESQFVHV